MIVYEVRQTGTDCDGIGSNKSYFFLSPYKAVIFELDCLLSSDGLQYKTYQKEVSEDTYTSDKWCSEDMMYETSTVMLHMLQIKSIKDDKEREHSESLSQE